MEYKRVTSSNIAAIGYDAANKWLGVEFLNGTVYSYFDVPKSIYDLLLETNKRGNSVGKVFNANVKGIYEFIRVN